jgi:predicted nucleic acid-binding protein
MRAVFLDTVGIMALWSVQDQWHPSASSVFETLLKSHCDLITTGYVMMECGNAAARTPFRADVNELRTRLESRGGLIWASNAEWMAAWHDYQQGTAGDASIVDVLSFAIMRRLKLTDAFSNDHHFQIAGFNTLF